MDDDDKKVIVVASFAALASFLTGFLVVQHFVKRRGWGATPPCEVRHTEQLRRLRCIAID